MREGVSENPFGRRIQQRIEYAYRFAAIGAHRIYYRPIYGVANKKPKDRMSHPNQSRQSRASTTTATGILGACGQQKCIMKRKVIRSRAFLLCCRVHIDLLNMYGCSFTLARSLVFDTRVLLLDACYVRVWIKM